MTHTERSPIAELGASTAPAQPDVEAAAQLPSDRRQQLVEAVKLADIQHIETMLAELETDWPQAAQAIKPFIDDFRYDELIALLRQADQPTSDE